MKFLQAILLAFVLLCLTLAGACGEETNEEDLLAGVTWELTSYSDETGTHPVLEDTEVTLNFNIEEKSLGGSAGCNLYGGDYTIDGSSLTVQSVFHTEMYCMTEGVMEQESDYLKALGTAETFDVDGDTLTITGSGGTINFKEKAD
jgi:heat shock protein HslJ